MPLYAYKCENCGQTIEVIQKFSDPKLDKCEQCQGSLVRLTTRPSFHLKGSGWYKDSYSSAKPNDKQTTTDKPATDSQPSKSEPASANKNSDAKPKTPINE